jgi:hypothetical protein
MIEASVSCCDHWHWPVALALHTKLATFFPLPFKEHTCLIR